MGQQYNISGRDPSLLFAKKKNLDEGRDSLFFQVFPGHLYFMRGHSLVELAEHDNRAVDTMVHSVCVCVCVCIY